MNTLMILLGGRKNAEKLRRIEEKEKVVAVAQYKSLAAIDNANKNAHNLKRVLEANHISIKIHKAIGNKNDPVNIGRNG